MTDVDFAGAAALVRSDFLGLVEVRERTVVWANAAMHRIFGYNPRELLGQPTRIFFPDDASYQAFARAVYPVLQTGGVFGGEVEQRRKDGSLGWFRFNISLRSDESDIIVAAVIDVTEQRRA